MRLKGRASTDFTGTVSGRTPPFARLSSRYNNISAPRGGGGAPEGPRMSEQRFDLLIGAYLDGHLTLGWRHNSNLCLSH